MVGQKRMQIGFEEGFSQVRVDRSADVASTNLTVRIAHEIAHVLAIRREISAKLESSFYEVPNFGSEVLILFESLRLH